jgi:hypothetical protein
MSSIATTTPVIVETSRGPCIAGRRTTVYVILAHLNNGCDREFIRILLDHDIEGYVVFLEVVLYLDNSSSGLFSNHLWAELRTPRIAACEPR